MANPSLQIGDSNWAIKEDNLLGYSTAGTRFVPQPITMTRASAGTRVNSSGLVETVELLGSELVTNGDFESGTSGWSAYYSGTLNNTGNALNVVDAGAGGARASTSITTVIGKTYKFVSDVLQVQSTNTVIAVSNAVNLDGAFINSTITTPTNGVTVYFTATATTTFIGFKRGGGGVGVTNIYDNVSVKESTKNNLARVDYDGTASSLLVEPMRTNLLPYSEVLNSTAGVVLSDTISPDGTLNGLKLTETTDNSQHYGTTHTASVVNGTTYTVSFYIKKGTYDEVKVYTSSGFISASVEVEFSTESTTLTGGITGSNFMEDSGNGWYRVGFSGVAIATGSMPIFLPTKDLSTYVGSTSQYTEYWGIQVEEGSYPTSYIPTDGGTVTRVKDQYTKTGISNLIGQTEGVIFMDWIMNHQSNSTSEDVFTLSVTDGTTNNLFVINNYNNALTVYLKAAGTNQFSNSSFSGSDGLRIKLAFAYKVNDFSLVINGSVIATDNSGSVPLLNKININAYETALPNDSILVKDFKLYTTRLTDSELIALTTI